MVGGDSIRYGCQDPMQSLVVRSVVVLAAPDDVPPGSATPQRGPERGIAEPEQDDDNSGLHDPYIDDLLNHVTSDEPDDDAEVDYSSDDSFVNIAEPLDLNMGDADQFPLVVPIDLFPTDDAVESSFGNDDEQGTQFDVPLMVVESTEDALDDGADEGPVESPIALDDSVTARPLDGDKDSELEEYTADPIGLYVDDIDLPWSKERWTEHAVAQAYTACSHLALVGGFLCVSGQSTHIHDARTCRSVDELHLPFKTARVVALDLECRELLILTATGQLLTYARATPQSPPLPMQSLRDAMVGAAWQLAPGVRKMLLRLENGQFFDLFSNAQELAPRARVGSNTKLLALSELGEPRVSLWRDSRGPFLLVESNGDALELNVNAGMARAIGDARPILIGFNDTVLFGARDHGLWLCRANGGEFLPVPGCRSLTSITVGQLAGRATAFVGLFSELEDRSEIATVDLATGRAIRIAELCIHTDCVGPEDDPPELARIDSLIWDQNTSRLWVAGGFGLTCFCPPSTAPVS